MTPTRAGLVWMLPVALAAGCAASSEGRRAATRIDVHPVDAGASPAPPAPGAEERTLADASATYAAGEAQRHWAAGRAAVERGEHASAAEHFRAAYSAEPRPELLYDLGYALELAGERGEAALVYEEYVRKGDLSYIDRMSMELRIKQLRAPAP